MRPLFSLPEIEKRYNETWIADFLAIPTVMHQLDPEITLYEGIYLLPAGHTLTVRTDGLRKQQYWRVERQPELKFSSDAEYEEAFREVLGEAVRRASTRSAAPAGCWTYWSSLIKFWRTCSGLTISWPNQGNLTWVWF